MAVHTDPGFDPQDRVVDGLLDTLARGEEIDEEAVVRRVMALAKARPTERRLYPIFTGAAAVLVIAMLIWIMASWSVNGGFVPATVQHGGNPVKRRGLVAREHRQPDLDSTIFELETKDQPAPRESRFGPALGPT